MLYLAVKPVVPEGNQDMEYTALGLPSGLSGILSFSIRAGIARGTCGILLKLL